jgi:DNA-binding MarR family transcriptional regulator
VQRLEDHGLVSLHPDRKDRRVVRVQLTESGAAVRAKVVARRRELIRELVGEAGDLPVSRELAWLGAALEAAI